jgi:hypothetical protein
MKVYMPSLSLSTINLNKIKKFLKKKTTTNFIYSNKGIFQIHKNNLMRLEILDIPCKQFKIDECDFIIDYSTIKFQEECMQLPLEHYTEQVISYEYSLRSGGQVHLVIEYNSSDLNINKLKINNLYFLANDDLNSQILNEDIISFLEELKLC